MSREFVRPGIGPRLMAELVPANTAILVNPSWDELRVALSDVEKQCRKHRLPPGRLRELFDRSRAPGFFSATVLTEQEAPAGFKYDVLSSQAAACWLGEGLTGFVLRRAATPPGEAAAAPIYPLTPDAGGDFDPAEWLESVCNVFWTRLADSEITVLERWMLTEAMVKAAREDEIRRAKERIRRERAREREQQRGEEQQALEAQRAEERRQAMDILFHGVEPAFATQLSDACIEIAAVAAREGQDSVRWADFKKRWQAIADRYSNDLLPLLVDGRIPVAALREIQGPRDFTLGFSLWTGAQRIFQAVQLVFRVECRRLLMRMARADRGIAEVKKEIINLNDRSRTTHPTETWGVGWLRVHVDDANRLVFVDEVQSDVSEMLEREVHPSLREPADRVLRALKPWHLHGFASVRRWARSIGYRPAIHSRQSCLRKPGMTRSDRKWNVYYHPIIRQFGLKEEAIAGYPAAIMVEPHAR